MDKEELYHQSTSNQNKCKSKEALQENLPLEHLDQISKSVPELSVKKKCKQNPFEEQIQRYNSARRNISEKLREEHKAIAKQMLKIIEDKRNENVICDQFTSHQSRCISSEMLQQNPSSDFISILPKVSTKSLVNKIVMKKRTQEQTDQYNAARRRTYWSTKRTPEQKEKRNAKLRNTEVPKEQRERRNAAQRVSALTVEQHERRKARQKEHLMTAEQIEKKRASAKLYKECQRQRKINKPRVVSSSDDEI